MEKVFKIFFCKKIKLIFIFEKTPFYASSLGNGLKKFNLELSNLLMEPKVVLPTLTLMNHHYNYGKLQCSYFKRYGHKCHGLFPIFYLRARNLM
jgi:hypothetical protein